MNIGTWQVTVFMKDGTTREMEYFPDAASMREMAKYIETVATTYKNVGVVGIEIFNRTEEKI